MSYKSLDKLLNGVRKAFVEDQKDKGIRASGQSADTMRIETSETGGQLVGKKYFIQQKLGRKPGKFPPIDDIIDWIRVKKITPRDVKTTERQLAFLFARKIAQKGTDIFLKKRPGLDPSKAVEQLVKTFMEEFAKEKKKEFVETIKMSVR